MRNCYCSEKNKTLKSSTQQTEKPAYNWRFGAMAALARRNGSAILEVSFPPKHLCSPALPQAADRYVQFGRARAGQSNNKLNIKSK
jgi:hypothetical protein